MALADIPPIGQPRRLDSWKEVAEYVGRDVRTATRWESQGMPVHRVPGGRGTSVFAFTAEIDAWLAGNRWEQAAPVPHPATAPAIALPPPSSRTRTIVTGAVCAIAVALAVAAMAFRGDAPGRDTTLHVTATETAVSIAAGAAIPSVIHQFESGQGVLVQNAPARLADLNADGEPEVLVGVSFYQNGAARSIRDGELLNLSPAGGIRWRFGFDDVMEFGGQPVRGPWTLSDWQQGPAASPARVAVAAHDYTWWASMAAVLDHTGRRISTFVNPGWIESLLWLDRERLAIAGFNNARNGAMLAIVNANQALGQAPGSEGTPFQCTTCPQGPPLFYATFPRSELNVLTASRFNRAQVTWLDDRVLVTTAEVAGNPQAATGLYEFDVDLRLIRARYSDTYWDVHRRLELEGRIAHARESCPERDGPAAIHVWSGTDWIRTPVSR